MIWSFRTLTGNNWRNAWVGNEVDEVNVVEIALSE